jgi:hypothetical protein
MWIIKGAWKCIQAQIKWFKRGSKYTRPEVALIRLKQCVPCTYNVDDRCQGCGGCPIMAKVEMNTEFCPYGYWEEEK